MTRPFGALLAAMLFVSPGIQGISSAAAQDWPNKPVRIVNTFAPGGAADYLARTIADGLSSTFGQQFFVETRSGAAGAIGVNSVVSTPPDGYNFVITNITMLVLAPISNPRLGYHPERDLTNLAYLGGSPVVLSVNAKSPIKSLADFIAHGRKAGKPLTYSSSGVGSSGHLFGETFARKVGIKVEHVPYKGAAQGLLDLVGGHIEWSAQTVTSSAGQIRGGTLRGIAMTAKQRMPDYPDTPTFAELGHPEFNTPIWFTLSAPKGLPQPIVDKMNGEINKIMTAPAMVERMQKEGMVVEAMTPAQLQQLIETETRFWRPAIEQAGLMQK
ncbi:MAG: tripartite tricarboxylate transporter substrate binding protein [Xanthobacteraceae bacterium]|nr:tripartite tricarboxylate transporter substrate binding protein [Xanthobacteraceae bacterium]